MFQSIHVDLAREGKDYAYLFHNIEQITNACFNQHMVV